MVERADFVCSFLISLLCRCIDIYSTTFFLQSQHVLCCQRLSAERDHARRIVQRPRADHILHRQHPPAGTCLHSVPARTNLSRGLFSLILTDVKIFQIVAQVQKYKETREATRAVYGDEVVADQSDFGLVAAAQSEAENESDVFANQNQYDRHSALGQNEMAKDSWVCLLCQEAIAKPMSRVPVFPTA